uniref:INO80 complex subunit E n=1 Tax=Cacopsylla melanoneura TaxID=428564 RepID=A0A8D8YBX4_9HEMI
MVMNEEENDSSSDEYIDYKLQYKTLKKKLKALITENECFQNVLKTSQRKLLKASRDKSFLLDRLLEYEKPVYSDSSDGEATESSDDEHKLVDLKRKKSSSSSSSSSQVSKPSTPSSSGAKKKKPTPNCPSPSTSPSTHKSIKSEDSTPMSPSNYYKSKTTEDLPTPPVSKPITQRQSSLDGHMTPEEVERHLESTRQRQGVNSRQEMFNVEPSLDSESNEVYDGVNTAAFLEEHVEDMIPGPQSL